MSDNERARFGHFWAFGMEGNLLTSRLFLKFPPSPSWHCPQAMLGMNAKEAQQMRDEVAAKLYRRLLKEEVTSKRIDHAESPATVLEALRNKVGGGAEEGSGRGAEGRDQSAGRRHSQAMLGSALATLPRGL